MPDFPDAEYVARLAAAQRAMHAAGIDALLLSTEAEVRYFSGFRTQFWQSPTRPWFLVVPADAPPIAVIPEIGRPVMARTWVEDIRTWSSPHPTDDGVSLVAAALAGCSQIGLPMGRESTLRMPLADFERLRAALPGAAFVNATPLIDSLRQVKSEAEIKAIEKICGIACDAFDRAPYLFSEGQPLDEAFRAFRIELLKQGAEDVPYLVGGAGPGGYGDIISPPGPEPLRNGDVLMLDTGAALAGYFCDFDRNFAIGRADPAARAAYTTLYDATEAGLAAARPGATCADLFRAMAAVIGATGDSVGRLGHGLGMQLTETPSIAAHDETKLVPGMVMTLEPSIEIAPGRLQVHEENIVIREGPPQLLTRRAPATLPEI